MRIKITLAVVLAAMLSGVLFRWLPGTKREVHDAGPEQSASKLEEAVRGAEDVIRQCEDTVQIVQTQIRLSLAPPQPVETVRVVVAPDRSVEDWLRWHSLWQLGPGDYYLPGEWQRWPVAYQ